MAATAFWDQEQLAMGELVVVLVEEGVAVLEVIKKRSTHLGYHHYMHTVAEGEAVDSITTEPLRQIIDQVGMEEVRVVMDWRIVAAAVYLQMVEQAVCVVAVMVEWVSFRLMQLEWQR